MPDDVALLLGRAGFGPTAAELAAARRAGYRATLSALTAPPGPDIGATDTPMPTIIDPLAKVTAPTTGQRDAAEPVRRKQLTQITQWWLTRMAAADHQAFEKLIFFWHGHWATSIDKVRRPQLMLFQQQAFRVSATFGGLAHRMVVDPALAIWLDGHLNTKSAPNENLGRELMELFMLGIGNYSEADVKAAGRALTGWVVDYARPGLALAPRHFDSGKKTILGTTKNFDPHSLVDFLLKKDACPKFLASRLWFRYGSSTQPLPASTRAKMVAQFPFALSMLRALFADEAFLATRGNLVKQPVEWVVGAMRQLGIRPDALDAETFDHVVYDLKRLGQVPFAPPSVGGWPAGATWLTAGAAQVRLKLAGRLAGMLPQQRRWTPESLAEVLAIQTWTDETYAALKGASRATTRLTLSLASPEYLVT
jgi:uncharacterized protein (DUF1800 family)